MNCDSFPRTNGYLHKFVTKNEIQLIKLDASITINKYTDINSLDKQYCLGSNNPQLNGFAYAIKNKENK